MYKNIDFGANQTSKRILPNGEILLRLEEELEEFSKKITDKLTYWAIKNPDGIFIAHKVDGVWNKLSYAQTLLQVKKIAQSLLDLGFESDETLVILSENSIEHALLSLAALYVGIPFSPISPPYSLVSNDFGKLSHCLKLLTPRIVFAQNSEMYKFALQLAETSSPRTKIITADGEIGLSFESLLTNDVSPEVEKRNLEIKETDVAKILFTSGSTGLPKGVINTHKMWCANLQQITQVFPFMKKEAPVFIDWLPWNHTFGGNHNFGLTLYNGGTLYLDEGKPTPSGIETTVQNLREISPTAYFNVPKGFEMLIPYLEKETLLRENFFRNINIIFYAGASLAQPVWDKLEELAQKTIGCKIPIITGLGCTESGPSAMFANWGGSFSGLLGVPVAGMEVKLVPDGDKLEARYKAPNVTPGYWRNSEATQAAFDEDGFYKTGDAVRFLDENDPSKGLVFDGRIAEDFKLSTGTWVNVGVLKAKVISSGSPIIQDVVFTGLDKSFIGAILFLNLEECKKIIPIDVFCLENEIFSHQNVQDFLTDWLLNFNAKSTGSSTRIKKFNIAIEPPSIDKGEITDKGSLNQRAVLKHRHDLVKKIYE